MLMGPHSCSRVLETTTKPAFPPQYRNSISEKASSFEFLLVTNLPEGRKLAAVTSWEQDKVTALCIITALYK